jgi:nicotinamidase/pyrazinamidase
MANTVIVVDMQRGFMSPEGTLYCGDEARKIIEPIRKLVEAESVRGSQIIFTKDTHDPDDLEFQMFPPHCVRGTAENEIIPELADLAANAEIVPKRRYSAFFETDLADRLARFKPDKVIVVGDCTDICVMHTVADLRNRDYRVEVPAECVASFDPEGHAFALKHMDKVLGATIT